MQVDHAVFTSVKGNRLDGYQIARATAGVTGAETRELAQWGPAHDSLLSPSVASVNFHTLSSGRLCVSRTFAAEAEYSGRGGARIETQFFLVCGEDFARFSNNPFRVLEAATAIGCATHQDPPRPLQLMGRASPLDRTLLAELLRDPGPSALCQLLDAVLRYPTVGVAWRGPLGRLFAGLVNLLPVGCRADLSFSSGLRYSARRVFRLLALPDDVAVQKRVEKAANLKVIDLDRPLSGAAPLGGWASVVRESLVSGRLADLGRLIDPQFSDRQPCGLAELAVDSLSLLETAR